MKSGCSSYARDGMLINLFLPAERATVCIDAVDICGDISKENGRSARATLVTDRDRRPHLRVGVKRPVGAAFSQAQCVHAPRRAADEHTAIHDRWLNCG
jgi:hypothetical protein